MKRILTLSLVLIFILSACAGPSESSATTATNDSQDASADLTEIETSNYPDYLNLESQFPIVKEGNDVRLSIALTRNSSSTDVNDMRYWKWAREKMNIDFDLSQLAGEGLAERMLTMFAGNTLPDIIIGGNLSTTDLVTYGQEEGQLLDISPYITEELLPNIHDFFEVSYRLSQPYVKTPDGKIYGLPNSGGGYRSSQAFGAVRLFINDVWLEGVGLETPATIDELFTVLRAFKEQDPNHVGPENVVPMGGSYTAASPMTRIMNSLGFSTFDGTGLTPALLDGEAVIPVYHERYREFVTIMHDLYREGLISPDFFTLDITQVRAQSAEGLVGATSDGAPYLAMPDSFQEWSAVAPLTSEVSDSKIAMTGNPVSVGGFVVSSETEYPEVALRFADFSFSETGSVYMWEGPPKDSEDTLGLTGGYYFKNESSISYDDLENGTFETEFDLITNSLAPWSNSSFGNNNYRPDSLYHVAGLEGPGKYLWEASNPDHHARMSAFEMTHDYLTDPYPIVYLTSDQNRSITDILSVIKPHVESEFAKFVTGSRSLTELDDFFTELEDMRIKEYKQIYVDAYDLFLANMAD